MRLRRCENCETVDLVEEGVQENAPCTICSGGVCYTLTQQETDDIFDECLEGIPTYRGDF
jgi:hypothetical protein